jgi:hypothetical protein
MTGDKVSTPKTTHTTLSSRSSAVAIGRGSQQLISTPSVVEYQPVTPMAAAHKTVEKEQEKHAEVTTSVGVKSGVTVEACKEEEKQKVALKESQALVVEPFDVETQVKV